MSGVKGQSGGKNRKTNREKELLGAASRRLLPDAPRPNQGKNYTIELKGLGPAGQLFFNKLVAALKANGTMGDGEELALHVLARRVEDWAKADRHVRKYGRWHQEEGKFGVLQKVSPWHRIERDLWHDLLQLQREYGITPLSRDQIRKLAAGEDPNPYKGLTA